MIINRVNSRPVTLMKTKKLPTEVAAMEWGPVASAKFSKSYAELEELQAGIHLQVIEEKLSILEFLKSLLCLVIPKVGSS